MALFHNLRLLRRMKKPNYAEPAIGWNADDAKSGVEKYGVANYEPLKSYVKIDKPRRKCNGGHFDRRDGEVGFKAEKEDA